MRVYSGLRQKSLGDRESLPGLCRPECILLLGGKRAWGEGNGAGQAVENNSAGGLYLRNEGEQIAREMELGISGE